MSNKKQYDLMCESLRNHRARLAALQGGTRNFKTIDKKIGDAIGAIDLMFIDLQCPAPAGDGAWMSDDKFEAVRENWSKTIKLAEEAEDGANRYGWKKGWWWFWIYLLGLMGTIGVYVYLHWQFRSTDAAMFLWVDKPRSYAEVAFWSFFGLCAWVLYNIQHYMRDGEDITKYTPWYLSKVLPGVLIAVVIIISFEQIDFGTTISNAVIPVLLGFILGYYSDRAREYLDLVRDKLLSGTQTPAVKISPVKSTLSSPVFVCGKVDCPPGTEGTLVVNDGTPRPITIDGNGNFAEYVKLEPGRSLVRVEAKSSAKKVGLASIEIALPGLKPVLTVSSPAGGSEIPAGKVAVIGTLMDESGGPYHGASVLLLAEKGDATSVVTGKDGGFSGQVELNEGYNLIRVLATGIPRADESVQTLQVKGKAALPQQG